MKNSFVLFALMLIVSAIPVQAQEQGKAAVVDAANDLADEKSAKLYLALLAASSRYECAVRARSTELKAEFKIGFPTEIGA